MPVVILELADLEAKHLELTKFDVSFFGILQPSLICGALFAYQKRGAWALRPLDPPKTPTVLRKDYIIDYWHKITDHFNSFAVVIFDGNQATNTLH